MLTIALDLCDFDSVTKCAAEFVKLKIPLDGLVNNAGMMTSTRQPTVVRVCVFGIHILHFIDSLPIVLFYILYSVFYRVVWKLHCIATT